MLMLLCEGCWCRHYDVDAVMMRDFCVETFVLPLLCDDYYAENAMLTLLCCDVYVEIVTLMLL